MDYSQRQNHQRIAYLIKCFPRTSETFILHEILELEHQGLPLRIFSLTHERVIEMYQHAILVVLPCVIGENGNRYGLPMVLVESLYMGVPVVSTPVSGIPELITPEVNGLLVAPRDSAALAAAIARLLADPRLCRHLALAGRQTVLARFDMVYNITLLLQLLLDHGSTGNLPTTTGKGFAVHTASLQNTLSNEVQAGVAYNSYQEYMS